jgi:hypothetical protein
LHRKSAISSMARRGGRAERTAKKRSVLCGSRRGERAAQQQRSPAGGVEQKSRGCLTPSGEPRTSSDMGEDAKRYPKTMDDLGRAAARSRDVYGETLWSVPPEDVVSLREFFSDATIDRRERAGWTDFILTRVVGYAHTHPHYCEGLLAWQEEKIRKYPDEPLLRSVWAEGVLRYMHARRVCAGPNGQRALVAWSQAQLDVLQALCSDHPDETGLAQAAQQIASVIAGQYSPGYTDIYGDIVDETAEFLAVAEQEDISPVELRKIIDTAKAAKGEVTKRETKGRSTAEPHPEPSAPQQGTTRLKWKEDRDVDEGVAHFAARAYAVEIGNGTFDKSLIRREDKTLYQRLFRDGAWPEFEVLISARALTKSQMRATRQVEAVKAIGLAEDDAQRVVSVISGRPTPRLG